MIQTLLQRLQHTWKHHLPFRLALLFLLLAFFIALTADVLPLPFTPNQTNTDALHTPPFSGNKHFLGTDRLGRDVFTNTVYGFRTGLLISLLVMLPASLIGILMGGAAGYFGDTKLKISRATLLFLPPALFLGWYACFYLAPHLTGSQTVPALTITAAAGLLFLFVSWKIVRKTVWWGTTLAFPTDTLVLRAIELCTSIPRFIVILALAAFFEPSVQVLATLAILTSWPAIARLARADALKITKAPFIEAAHAMGIPLNGVLFRYVLPNILPPVLVAFTFGAAGLMALESTLSFLNIGLPPELPSWGRTITGIRQNPEAWWLVVFPGLALSLTILALQTCGYYFLKSLRPD